MIINVYLERISIAKKNKSHNHRVRTDSKRKKLTGSRRILRSPRILHFFKYTAHIFSNILH